MDQEAYVSNALSNVLRALEPQAAPYVQLDMYPLEIQASASQSLLRLVATEVDNQAPNAIFREMATLSTVKTYANPAIYLSQAVWNALTLLRLLVLLARQDTFSMDLIAQLVTHTCLDVWLVLIKTHV